MKNQRIFIACLFFIRVLPVVAQKQVINWNFGWKFHRGALQIEQVKNLSNVRSVNGWEEIDIPHDFQISQPWVEPCADEELVHLDGASFTTHLSARAYKEMGEGRYVKTYTPSKDLKEKRILIDFEGIMYVGDVYLNGERIGGTDYGYVGFEIDLSNKLKYGETNVIAVMASTSEPMNSRWYTGGGLFRDVHLVITDPNLFLARHPLYIKTVDNRQVNVQIEVVNQPGETSVDLETKILDANGVVVYQKRKSCPFFSPVEAHDINHIPSNEIQWEGITLDAPRLWSCEDPYLYTVDVTLYDKNGRVVDHATARFGLRTIESGSDFGLKLNGKKVLLKGIANHHSLGALGAAAYPRAIEKRLVMLKDFGVNHIRTGHNPYSESFLDLCDSLGILVVDEIYDKWLDRFTGGRKPWMQIWTYDLPEWIKRDRNHPSVIVWSLGNEQQSFTTLPYNDFGKTMFRMMKELILRYDDTRKLTIAMHPRSRTLEIDGKRVVGLRPMGEYPEVDLPTSVTLESDIASYNYSYDYFKTDGARFPNMVFYQSEATANSMGKNFFEMDLNKVVGLAYWGMIGYLGESRKWPAKGWTQGVFDISLQPKPQAYLLKSMFKPEEPVVHIGIIDRKDDAADGVWNSVKVSSDGMSDHWNRIPGQKYDINVYTNADKVELVSNGKSIGMKENSMDPKLRNKIQFKQVEYQPGYIEAIAYKEGRRVTTHRVETAGKAYRLTLSADLDVWYADGLDLQHIRVTVIDRKGRRVPYAFEELTFRIEGDAHIVAVDNGDITSNEMMVGNKRTLYNGSALVILRAGCTPGTVTLTVSAHGYKTQKIKLDLK